MLLDDDDDPPPDDQQQQASGGSSSSSLRPTATADDSIDLSPHKSVRALRKAIQDRHLRSLRVSGDDDAAETFEQAVRKSPSSRRGGDHIGSVPGRWEQNGKLNSSHITATRTTTNTRNSTAISEEHTSTTKLSSTTGGRTYESKFIEEDDEEKSDSTGSETLSAILFNTPTAPVSSPARSSSSKTSKVTATTDSRSTVSGTPPRRTGSPQRRSSSPRMLKDPYGPNTRQLLAAFCQDERSTGKNTEERPEQVGRKHKQPTASSTETYPATITVRTFPLEEKIDTTSPTRAATATATSAACTQASLDNDLMLAQGTDIESQRPSGGRATVSTCPSQTPSTLVQHKPSGWDNRRFSIGVTIALLISFGFLAGGLYWWYSSTQ